MFGSLMKDVAKEDRVNPFLAKKDEAEAQRMFLEAVSLPNFHQQVLQLQTIRQKFEDESFTTQNISSISTLARAVTDISTFVSFVDFTKKDNEQINRISETGKEKFLANLKVRKNQM